MPKVYVGNLARSVSSSDLLHIFHAPERYCGRWPLQIRNPDFAAVSAS